jgi:Mitochondrial ribosome subunit S26
MAALFRTYATRAPRLTPYPALPHSRSLCAEPRPDKPATSRPNKPTPKSRKPDTPHVTRRNAYEASLSRLRVSFAAERAEAEGAAVAVAAARRGQASAGKAERQEARRRRSEALQPAVAARAEKMRVEVEERKVFRKRSWEDRNRAIDARKMTRVAALNAVAHEWVTEQNLDEKIDEMMDDFFIAEEAAEVARRGSVHVADVVSSPRMS